MSLLNRRSLGLAALAGLALGGTAHAQSFPARPLKMVVPFPPGAGTDITARVVAQKMGELLGQTVVVENIVGANGLLGTRSVARSAPDGYTMAIAVPGPMTIGQFLFPDMPYDPAKDFIPLGKINEGRLGLAVSNKLPVTSVKELVAMIRQQPGKLNAANPSVGSVHHLVAENFKLEEKLDFVLVPYKGGSDAINDLIGGHVDMMFNGVSTIAPQAKDGRLRPLMVIGATRSSMLPDVPCSQELGFPYLSGSQWQGLLLPAGTPQPIVARLYDALQAALAAPEVRGKLADIGTEVTPGTSEEFGTFMRTERERWGRIIKAANIKVD